MMINLDSHPPIKREFQGKWPHKLSTFKSRYWKHRINQGWHFWRIFLEMVLQRKGLGWGRGMSGKVHVREMFPVPKHWLPKNQWRNRNSIFFFFCGHLQSALFLQFFSRLKSAESLLWPPWAWKGSGQRVTSLIFLEFREDSARNSQ